MAVTIPPQGGSFPPLQANPKKSATKPSVQNRAADLMQRKKEAEAELDRVINTRKEHVILSLMGRVQELHLYGERVCEESNLRLMELKERMDRCSVRLKPPQLDPKTVLDLMQAVASCSEELRKIEQQRELMAQLVENVISSLLKSAELGAEIEGVFCGVDAVCAKFVQWLHSIRSQEASFAENFEGRVMTQVREVREVSERPIRDLGWIPSLGFEDLRLSQILKSLIWTTCVPDAVKQLQEVRKKVLQETDCHVRGKITGFQDSLAKVGRAVFIEGQQKQYLRAWEEFVRNMCERIATPAYFEGSLQGRAELVLHLERAFSETVTRHWISDCGVVALDDQDRLIGARTRSPEIALHDLALSVRIEPRYPPISPSYAHTLDPVVDQQALRPYTRTELGSLSPKGKRAHATLREPRLTIHAIDRLRSRMVGEFHVVFGIIGNPLSVTEGREDTLEIKSSTGTCIVSREGAIITVTLHHA